SRRADRHAVRAQQAWPLTHARGGHRRGRSRTRRAGPRSPGERGSRGGGRAMTQPLARPQDHLRIRPDAAVREHRVIQPRSIVLWTVLSLPLLGYFVWYWRALRDCTRLIDDDSDPWFWMAMLFPGLILVIPYMAAQARVVARVEVASRTSLS